MVALFAASFLDATPTFASRAFAEGLGFGGRPIHPLLCLNLALSFSVHDVSEQAIAHLAYLDVRFPNAAYSGDTLRAQSTVLDAKPASSGDRGVVHVRTVLLNQMEQPVCAFERKALIRAGKLESRPADPPIHGLPTPELSQLDSLPPPLRDLSSRRLPLTHFAASFESFAPEQVYLHQIGKTVGESEHMQLTALCRNSHPLHFDELYCRENSFTKSRVVYGGLVFAWINSLTSRDVAGCALWELGFDSGAHPNGVSAGDTLYAASKVLTVREHSLFGEVTFRVVGVKNVTSDEAYTRHGDALFTDEHSKKEGKLKEKVFEITRTLCIQKRA
jgi:2-methylfumaryl-CoA hydratase